MNKNQTKRNELKEIKNMQKQIRQEQKFKEYFELKQESILFSDEDTQLIHVLGNPQNYTYLI